MSEPLFTDAAYDIYVKYVLTQVVPLLCILC